MELTKEVFDEITANSRFTYDYSTVTDEEKAFYTKINKFIKQAEFVGCTFKGERGRPTTNTKSKYHNIRAIVFYKFKFETRIYKVKSTYTHVYLDIYSQLIRMLAGKLCSAKHWHPRKDMLIRHCERLLQSSPPGSKLPTHSELTEYLACQSNESLKLAAINAYAESHKKVSVALKNALIKYPATNNHQLVDTFEHVANTVMECTKCGFTQAAIIDFVKIAMHYHHELPHFGQDAKEEIINARLVLKVHH